MTTDESACSYFLRTHKRWLALQTQMQAEAYPDVLCEAPEPVELVLIGMLRWVGMDPQQWHDVSGILLGQAAARQLLVDACAVLDAPRYCDDAVVGGRAYPCVSIQ